MRILVINPNSTAAVTDGISRAVTPLHVAGGPRIECVTLAEGPPGIESDADVAAVVAPILACIGRADAAAYVIACFSDPGLAAARGATIRPVFGISECAYLTALTRGELFGVISILEASIPRHLRYIRQLGLSQRFAGDRAIGLGVTALAQADQVLERMIGTGRQLIEKEGADVLILGCAGMADYRADLESALGVPVIDPCQAAVSMALGRVLLSR